MAHFAGIPVAVPGGPYGISYVDGDTSVNLDASGSYHTGRDGEKIVEIKWNIGSWDSGWKDFDGNKIMTDVDLAFLYDEIETGNGFSPGGDSTDSGGSEGEAGQTDGESATVANSESNCFLEDTKVEMADGSLKGIQDIEIGDTVQSYDTDD